MADKLRTGAVFTLLVVLPFCAIEASPGALIWLLGPACKPASFLQLY